MTLEQLNRHITQSLTPALGAGEAAATARLLMEDELGATPKKIFTDGRRTLEPETVAHIDALVGRIAAGEPPQYVTGVAQFMGLTLKVTPAVLIPRPETAQLVDMITDDCGGRADLRVIDAGTGSGCIAIALSRALPFAHIEAIDISADALAVARENARRLGVRIDFVCADVLAMPAADTRDLDLIVSNPPYIADSEKTDMDSRVLDYEPHAALFVPDSDPLKFYRAIGRTGLGRLRPGGKLYFEINPLFASQLSGMLADQGYTDIEITPDYRGLRRFARATAPL